MTEAVFARVARLEELLARVKSRAVLTRDGAPAAHAAEMAAPSSYPPATEAEAELEVVDEDEAMAEALLAGEVSSELIEVDVDDDDETLSRAPAPSLELEVVDEEEEPRTPGANEVVDLAPSSSPRPIADESGEAFPVPRHTPPPESGKQVASAAPPPERPSSLPPDSLDGGHTLIGGWQKPGVPNVGAPLIAGGVRVPSPIGTLPPKESVRVEEQRPQPFRPEVSTQPSASQVSPNMGPPPAARLAPEVTKPAAPVVAKVATFEGAAPAFRPQSFGELLDASLGL